MKQTNRALFATEGGFGIQRTDTPPKLETHAIGHSEFVTETAFSVALDMSPTARKGLPRRVHPNSSLYFPQTHVPHLATELAVGTTWLIGAYAANTNPEDAERWKKLAPKAPTQAQLEKMVSDSERVLGMKYETHIPTLF